jgi:hypothetical protein
VNGCSIVEDLVQRRNDRPVADPEVALHRRTFCDEVYLAIQARIRNTEPTNLIPIERFLTGTSPKPRVSRRTAPRCHGHIWSLRNPSDPKGTMATTHPILLCSALPQVSHPQGAREGFYRRLGRVCTGHLTSPERRR